MHLCYKRSDDLGKRAMIFSITQSFSVASSVYLIPNLPLIY